MSKGTRFTDEFKRQIVNLYNSGRSAYKLSDEFDISTSTVYKWVKESNTTGSFKTVDNLTDEQKECSLDINANLKLFIIHSIFYIHPLHHRKH